MADAYTVQALATARSALISPLTSAVHVPENAHVKSYRPTITAHVASEHENVLLVREALIGFSQALDLDRVTLEDVLTAVTEACNNVALHAYPDGAGPLEFELAVHEDMLEAVVRDHGQGINPRLRSPRTYVRGIGFPVMQSLAQRVEFSEASDGAGTEVRMEFAIDTTPALRDLSAAELASNPAVDPGKPDAASVTIAPARLARHLLPRLLGVLAAKADFSTDRLSDVHILADALAAYAPGALDVDRLTLVATVAPRSLELTLGPLAPARADQLLRDSEIPGLGSVIERLTDDHSMSPPEAPMSMLTLRLRDPG
jgi:serine/threonine-protein kinase RsbW